MPVRPPPLAQLPLPEAWPGWQASPPDQHHDRRTLFEFMNGMAEVYLRYPFAALRVREYQPTQDPEAPRLTLQLFDMQHAAEAFGIFSFEREGPEVGIGQGSEYAAGLLRFWRGRFLVCLAAEQETPAARDAVLGLGRAVAAAIREPGEPPALIRHVPPTGLVPTRLRYFHEPYGLSYHFPLGEDNPLALGPRTDVVLASYQGSGDRPGPRLLLVRYPGVGEATAASGSLRQRVLAGVAEGTATPARGTGWSVVRRWQQHLVAVFDAASPEAAQALLAATGRSLEKPQ